MDSLCSDLRKKAKCSEGGVVLDKKDIEAAVQLQREGKMLE